MFRLNLCLLVCLLAIPGCVPVMEAKQWFLASDSGQTRSRVVLSTSGRAKYPPYKRPPKIEFRDCDGTRWEVHLNSEKPDGWFVYHIDADGQRKRIPFVQVPSESLER
jgi:hypothetical protein